MGMAEYFAGGRLRFVNGEWRNDDGDIIEISRVRHGRWVHERTEGGFHIWRCNRCGRGMNANPEGTDLYCYHCGAKMDEEVSE